MKYISLLLWGLIISFSLSAQLPKRTINLSGSINDKYAILMTLTIQGEKVIGFYYYDKYKSKILLEGEIKDNKVVLNESPGYESEFEIGFMGDLDDKSFSGIWTNKPQNKTMKFNTLIYADNTISQNIKASEIEGRYESNINSEKYLGSVELEHIADNTFAFSISNGTESGCAGYLKGLIELTDFKEGNYAVENCEEIQFVFSNQMLNLTEKNCDYHGMNCPFEGSYKKETHNK
ncbi:hypothetical protein KEM09_19775 [Carboxylicivirga mesophila]|uniref:Uncharacterized protein n=1 Tax=Carboxylicivirga mesophila TaxID=1166478 RepID=A0ABS5KF23_9BACT|nr:hypothetical protein [Carboxylicivirga mesophila]MBS2213658.1 hypothetical protein [Carboxylicivirga mesophila]